MSLSTAPTEKALAEATSWFARLKKHDVPQGDMDAFQTWFGTADNKAAYDVVDAFWRDSERVKANPAIQDAVAAALARTSRPKANPLKTRGAILGLGLAFGALVLTASFFLSPRTYSTEVGEQRTIRLADGSTMTLDTNSKATVRLARARRDITLGQGQALFEVAHDATRPFVVTAGKTSVTALGTQFDVRREAAGATVILVRGAVEVRERDGAKGRVWRLAPGQRVSTAAAVTRPTLVDGAAATSWTTGRLVFHDVPLRQAVAEFNRYERRRIELQNGPWDEDRISGAFDVDDTNTFVGSVAKLHDLEITRPEKSVIRLARAGDSDAVQ